MLLINTLLIISILLFSKNQLEKIEEKELNYLIVRIKNCIDIENKNKRTLNENIKLSEYCIDKFCNF